MRSRRPSPRCHDGSELRNSDQGFLAGRASWTSRRSVAVASTMCCYTASMARTDKKVGYSPTGKLEDVTPDMAASGIETAFRMLEGRWKMVIIFHLFDKTVLRF